MKKRKSALPGVPPVTNARVAEVLEQVADLLEAQAASPFRVHAHRTGAETVRAAAEPLTELTAREVRAGLERLPRFGPALAALILELIDTGRLRLLDRLRGALYPEDLLASIPRRSWNGRRRSRPGSSIFRSRR